MKKSCFFTILLVASIGSTKAQFLAGDQSGNYYDFVPDTSLTTPQFVLHATANLLVDVNNDGAADIKFIRNLDIYASVTSMMTRATVLNPNVSILVDSIGPGTDSIPKQYNYGDTIQAGPVEADNVFFYGYSYVPNVGTSSHGTWVSVADKYIGFSFFNGTSKDYGWIRVTASSTGIFTFKDLDLNATAVGLKVNKTNEVSVCPNPTAGKIYIKTNRASAAEISVYDITGKQVIQTQNLVSDEQAETDLSALENGVYFLKVKDPDLLYVRRIVLQH